MAIPLLLVGGGGHCASCIDVVESSGLYSITGVVDTKDKLGSSLLGYRILGTDDDLPELWKEAKSALITIGQLKSAGLRTRLYHRLKELQFYLPVVIAKTATVARSSVIEDSCIIMHYALINSGARIAENCIINTRAVIEHDARIGAHTHVSTGAIVNGGCILGNACLIGSGSVLKQGVVIGSDVVIGAGSIVLKDIMEPGVYAGNPARKINV